MDFISASLQKYCDNHTQPEPPLLAELTRQTHLKVLNPRMLSGHFLGRFLSLISKLVRPNTILELGTYTGYSALCLAEGLGPDGRLHSIDPNPETNAFAQSFINKSEYANQIHLHEGDANKMIPMLGLTPDLVFIDADKENYLNYYNAIMPGMRSGGVLLTDNVLWSGKVVDKSFTDPNTEAIRMFNSYIAQDQRVEQLLLPIRDGIYVVRKK